MTANDTANFDHPELGGTRGLHAQPSEGEAPRQGAGKRPARKGAPKRRRRLAARAAVAAALACCLVAGGAYASYAFGLSQSDYTWYLRNPDADEFVISNTAELNALAQLVNGTAKTAEGDSTPHDPVDFAGKRIVVDMPNKTMALNTVGTSNQTVPIGTADHPFEGSFDGNGLSVTGLLITERTESNTGLFGVVGAGGSVSNVNVEGTITINSDTPLSNVGGVVGDCQGTLSGCTSGVKMSIENSYKPTKDLSTPVNNIGGVVGRMNGSLSKCSFNKAGTLTIRDAQDSIIDENNAALPVAMGVGGVVGMFGSADEATTGIAIDGCSNQGALYLSFTGGGGKDRFGVAVVSKPAAVGGIAGYSSGSISNCSNEGELRTSTKSAESGVYDEYGYDTTFDNGAMQLGGIVGNLRNRVTSSHFSSTLEPDNGTKDNPLEVRNCWNKGLVIGSNQTGGIVGTAGTYTLITECANGNYTGNNRVLDGQLVDKHTQGAVICTRWNKPFAGGIAGTTMGSVTFCYNRAQINNTQGGYYIAGIVGGLGSDKIDTLETIKNDPAYECEMHSCWNLGQIAFGHKTSNKYGALLGLNDGYVHDCVVLEGCVIIGQVTDEDDQPTDEDKTSSDAIGDLAWKSYRNISVLKEEDLRTSAGLAILNSYAQRANGFTNYWFSGEGTNEDGGNYNDRFPVLRSWATPNGATDIGTIGLTELSCDFAPYNPVTAPVPEVSLGTGSGVKLVQNVDYVIRAQEGAMDMTVGAANETPYKYTVVGIGKYTGEFKDFGKYGIGAGSLEDMSVHPSSPKFNWEVQFPESVRVLDQAGNEVPSDDYDYVIYDSATNNLSSKLSPKLVAFDSAGYLSFDGGTTLEPALEAQKNTAGKAFKVYDRNEKLIADSDGGVYDPETGALVTGTTVNTVVFQSGSKTTTANVLAGAGLMNYKVKQVNQPLGNDCDAGYVLEVQGKGAYENSTATGRYIIRAANIAEDCQATVSYNGEQWLYDNMSQKLYQEADGQKVWGMDTDFTGDPVRPSISLTYLGRTLSETRYGYINDETGACYIGGDIDGDFVTKYGPISQDSVVEANPYPNRNASNAETADIKDVAAVDAAFDSGSNVAATKGPVWGVRCFDNYIMGKFNVNGVDIATCDVTVSDQAVPQKDSEGNLTQVNPVHVSLSTDVKQADGSIQTVESTLKEGTDYTVSYQDAAGTTIESPTAKGSYRVVVTPKAPNLTGAAITQPFAIVDAETFSVEAVPTTWDVGKLYPSLKFADGAGKALDLRYGIDYTYEIYTPYATSPYVNEFTRVALPYIYWNSGRVDSPLTVKVTGLGKYAGAETVDCKWKINPVNLADTKTEDWTIEGEVMHDKQGEHDRIYSSINQLEVRYKGYQMNGLVEWLKLGSDPAGDVHAGTEVTLIIKPDNLTPKYGFTGEKVIDNRTFIVQPCDLMDMSNWTPNLVGSTVYSGAELEPVKIAEIAEGEDYTIAYRDNVDAGTASYVVTGTGDFTGVRKGSFTIDPKPMRADSNQYQVDVAAQTFTGGQIKPEVVVTDVSGAAPVTLEAGKDYTVAYGSNVEGTGYVYVTGKGNYITPQTQELTASFSIVKDEQNVTYWVEYVDEEGEPVAHAKEVSGKKAGDTVTEDALAVDGYKLKDASQATQQLQLASGQKNVITFVYVPREVGSKNLADAAVADVPAQLLEVATKYNPGSETDAASSDFARALKDAGGKGLADSDIWKRYGAEPALEVTYQGAPLAEGVDYEVSYDEHRNVGTATATLTGMGEFEGTSAAKDYRIVGYVAHKIDELRYDQVGSMTDELRAYWEGVGTDKVFPVPNWGTSNTWTDVPQTSKFRAFLADGTVPSFKVSVADPLALHPQDNHDVPVYGMDGIDPDRAPADTVELAAADGSWRADALYTFTKTYPGYGKAEYALEDLYDVSAGSPAYLYQASGMGALAESWARGASPEAELKSDLVAAALGAAGDKGASLVDASVELSPDLGSLKWSVAAPATLGAVTVSDAGLSEAVRAAVASGFLQDFPVKSSYRMQLSAKVMPYDLTPDSADGSYSGAYAGVNGDFLATLANGGYDGASASSLAHGATVSVNGGEPVAATGEALDVTGAMLSVVDAFGGDVMESADAALGTDYAVSYERKGADGSFSAVSEVRDPGAYRVTVKGACKSIGKAGSIVGAANKRLYAGSVSGEFEVVAQAPAKDLADAAVADVPAQLLEVATKYNPGSETDAASSDFARALKDAGGKGLADSDIWKRYGAEPALEVTYQGAPLAEGVDYEVSYDEHRNVGTATATLTGMGEFEGTSAAKDYRIVGYVAHKIDELRYDQVGSMTDELRAYWEGVGTDKVFPVPNWGTSNTWTDVPQTSKFRAFLADGTVPSFKVSVADPLALHPQDNHDVPVYGMDGIDPDRAPADTVELAAADGSWRADALYTFTKTYPGYGKAEYALEDLYDVSAGSPAYLYQASGMGALAESWARGASPEAELKSDLVAAALGAAGDKGASLVDASVELSPDLGSLKWSVAAPATLGAVTVSDAGLSEAVRAAVASGFLQDFPVKSSYRMQLSAKVMPYDLTPDSADGSYSGAYAGVNGDFLATLANGGYDGASASSLAHGATVSVNGGEPVAATGEALDVTGAMLSVVDAFGGDVMESADAALGTDYAVSYERKGADGSFSAVSEVRDPGAYRVTVKGACKSIGKAGSIVGAANKRLYAGSVSGEFEVVADATALDAAIAAADDALANVPVSVDGKDIANGSVYVDQSAHDALSAAVLAAKTARAESYATQDALDAAARALEQAQKDFEGAKRTAKTDAQELGVAIDAARALVGGVVASTDGLDVPGGSTWATPENIAVLNEAIEVAQAVLDDDHATQNAMDAATAAVGTATNDFKSVLNTATPSKTDLKQAVQDANAKHGAVLVSADGAEVANGSLWTTKAASDGFAAAIKAAQGVLDNGAASQNQVNEAKAALGSAADDFDKACAKAVVSYGALAAAYEIALADRANTDIASKADEVYVNRSWVRQADADALDAVLARAQTALREQALSQKATDALADELAHGQTAFDAAKQKGAKPLPVASVSVTLERASGNKGFRASATVLPEGCLTDVTWSSSDESVAVVDASGNVTPRKDGVVRITATSTADPDKSGSASFAVVGMDGTSDKKDALTGVTVQGVPSGTEVVIVDASGDPLTSVDELHKVIGSFEIELWAVDAQGNRLMTVQPTQDLAITMPVASGFAGREAVVYAYHSDGGEQTFETRIAAGDTATVSGVSHLSRFEVVVADDRNADGSNGSIPSDTNAGSSGRTLAPTGDGMPIPAIAFAALAAITALVLTGRRAGKARLR